MRKAKLFLLVPLVAAALLPAAGSFVPGGGGIFGGKAEAACKYSLSNHFTRWYGSGAVLTDWCYDGRSVTWRHSTPYANANTSPDAGSWHVSFRWALSTCNYFNGIHNHNCLTQGEFSFYSYTFGHKFVCAHTRIYGNGAHVRHITDGLCPASTLGRPALRG